LLPAELEVKSANEGINIYDPDISLRSDIIPTLTKDLIDKDVILVHAPPFSGKTSLAQILEYTLVRAPEFKNHRVIRISLLWESNFNWNTFGEKWKKIIGISWVEWVNQRNLIPSILIVDEAHLIYEKEKNIDGNDKESADQFWMVVKSAIQEMANIKIIMFATYRYKSNFNTGLTTFVTLPSSHYKSLIDINFTPSELKKYVEKFSSKYFKNLDPLSISNLYEYIRRTCGFGSSHLGNYGKRNEESN
jgi:hypothetical protein